MGQSFKMLNVYYFISMINYHNKQFRPISNTENGETSAETLFLYQQNDHILTCTYSGGKILIGHLIGLVDDDGNIDMRYHQVNEKGALMTGFCHSRPEILPDGRIRLHENWQWTSGDRSAGKSILEEVYTKINVDLKIFGID